MKPKVLLTGTLGFIGSNFIRYVVEKHDEYQWVGVDKAVYDYCLKNTFEHPNYKFYLADIANEHIMDRIFQIEKPDFIVNLAAESFVCSSIENPNPFIYSNVMGAQTLINMSVKYGIEKFLQISTDEVMGHHLSISEKPWTEEDGPKPRNPYAASKFAAENILYAANQTHKLPFNITRCCNVFGPRQPCNRNLVPKAIWSGLTDNKMPIYGDGSHMREYLYVEDKIRAIMTVLKFGQQNEIYNIGSGTELTNTEVVGNISAILDKKIEINYTTDRKGHDFRYAVDCRKLKSLGWKLLHSSFTSELEKTIKWYKNNPWFYSDL